MLDIPHKPEKRGGCWAVRPAAYGAAYGGLEQCGKKARPGALTCHWHRANEASAQRLKAQLDAKKEE